MLHYGHFLLRRKSAEQAHNVCAQRYDNFPICANKAMKTFCYSQKAVWSHLLKNPAIPVSQSNVSSNLLTNSPTPAFCFCIILSISVEL